MIPKQELNYRILKFISNNLVENGDLRINKILEDLNLIDFIPNSQDIIDDLQNSGLIEALPLTQQEMLVVGITLDGKYYIEDYLKENSNLIELDRVIEITNSIQPINIQLRTAKKYIASTDSNDYRNAVKEAISALETTLKIALKNDKIKLKDALNEISKRNKMHRAFKDGISNLFGFNSDSGGVRHGLKEEDLIIDYSTAKLLVNIYINFINYIVELYNLNHLEKSSPKT